MPKPKKEKLLADHTSLKIGGPVFCWTEPKDIDELLDSVSIARSRKKSILIIGRGCNILAPDNGFDGVVIKLGPGFDYIEREGSEIVKLGAGSSIQDLVARASQWGLGGCEFLAGIPGSAGGAIFMNAGIREKEIKDIILEVEALDMEEGSVMSLKRQEIYFGYRSSGLDGMCILGARIKLNKDKNSAVEKRIEDFIKRREWMRGLGLPSAGSVFKNPNDKNPAGRLIEACDLKGWRIGGAEISNAHANFIVNKGGASSKDVLGLIDLARKSVKEKFGIDLELEIKII
ncbi:MAG: UDP-N-acetylmuramate dehydrogenase [Candidatus Omnitrophica bacterium]|nr:UDP-N-acetylmuramate dehydrogenase [Candidatus Omnitrophota bacterium]MBU4457856.1 UDP-N-acetylmuramate dehydrogenase [Candidatus Omnitrophota bacterium]